MSDQESATLGWDYLFRSDKVHYDSAVPFLTVCQMLAGQSRTIIDVGCGRGAQVDHETGRAFQDLRGTGRHVVGLDVDPEAAVNPIIDEFRAIDGTGRWPLGDGEADLVVSDFTLEHVGDPAAFTAELARVLRPGGGFVARTVSRRSPLALTARAVPNRRHAGVLATLQPARLERDVFPTRYLMNSRKQLSALLSESFDWSIAHRGGLDQYLLRSRLASRAVATAEPHLPRSLQTIIIVQGRRRSDQQRSAGAHGPR